MRLIRPGFAGRCLYPEALFRVKTGERFLYLTFDDGPDPASTPRLLEKLKEHNIPAVFFCTGKAAEQHPDLITRIFEDGHIIGNHGYDHLDGWRTGSTSYSADVERASPLTSDAIFRPPYGRITPRQAKILKRFKIVFWDIMAFDFDRSLGISGCLRIIRNHIRPGSIVVLHDSPGSLANLLLDDLVKIAREEDYSFQLLRLT